ncbi:hypothetical protein Si133o_00993 [Streptococcus infantarius subsp. infantarius]|nr:hypothetical protein [Streptococcus infantarius subsp. infantarius]
MTKNFKEADETFQELMRAVNDRLIGLNSVAISDNKSKKCKDNKGLSLYKNDNIISPNHYVSDNGIEVFDVQEAFIHELKGMAASYWCNIVKYILRFQRKNGVEDLKKARYYLDKLIEEETDNE